jgi:RNA polymerase sigma-70 factor, ECF subfamily
VPIGTIMSRLSRARQTIGAAFGAGKDPLVKRRESKETLLGRNG